MQNRAARGLCRAVLWCAAAATLSFAVPAARGQNFPAAASDEHAWFVLPDKSDPKRTVIIVMHRQASDDAGVVRQATKLAGTLATPGLAAAGDRVWLVFDDRAVRSLRAVDGERGLWSPVEMSFEPAMPGPGVPGPGGPGLGGRSVKGGKFVRSLAASHNTLWALLRVEDARTMGAIDGLTVFDGSSPRAGGRPAPRVGPAPGADDAAGDAPAKTQADDAAGAGAARDGDADAARAGADGDADADADADASVPARSIVRADRLIRLGRTGWQRVPLPADWPNAVADDAATSQPGWLVIAPHAAESDWPRLAVLLNPSTLRVYEAARAAQPPSRPAADPSDAAESAASPVAGDAAVSWTFTDYSLAAPPPDPSAPSADASSASILPPIIVERQLVVGQRVPTAEGLHVQLTMLRPDDQTRLGTLSIDAPVERWTLMSIGAEAALVGVGDDGLPRWSRMSLAGTVALPATELKQRAPSPLDWGADLIVLVIVLAAASPVIILLWRRDPSWNKLELPKTLALSMLGPRVAAAAIDLAPGLAVMLLVFDVPLNEVFSHWPGMPGQTPQWERMLPGAVAIAVYVTHCTVFEAVSGASLGKLLLGLRVRDLKGQPPKLWQIAVRNAMKALELIVPFLLILPIMGPYRQRLGDLVARTVVVTPARQEEEGE